MIRPPAPIERFHPCAMLGPLPDAPRIGAPLFTKLQADGSTGEVETVMPLSGAAALLEDLTRAAAWRAQVRAWSGEFDALCREETAS